MVGMLWWGLGLGVWGLIIWLCDLLDCVLGFLVGVGASFSFPWFMWVKFGVLGFVCDFLGLCCFFEWGV